MTEWQRVETAPYETPVLTFWPGNATRSPVYVINTKNSGREMGERDKWWRSLPDEAPTHWMPLPSPPRMEH